MKRALSIAYNASVGSARAAVRPLPHATFRAFSSAAAGEPAAPPVHVHIEHCNACGSTYFGVCNLQIEALEAKVPGAKVTSSVGRTRSFEVTVDAKYMVHSKHLTTKFPNVHALASAVAAYASTPAREAQPGWIALPPPEQARVAKLMKDSE